MKLGAPPLRASQRQVIAYLPPDLCDALKVRAAAGRLTLREMLALSVNAELAAMGLGPALTPERQRQFQRVQRAAAPRAEGSTAAARRGRKALAGWFDRKEANHLRDLAAETGRSVQEIAECGARRLAAGEGEPVQAA